MTLSGDLWGNKSFPVAYKTASGSYLGIFPNDQLYTRTTADLNNWAGTRTAIPGTTGRYKPTLIDDGSGGILMLVTTSSAFEIYRTVDEGVTFSLLSATPLADIAAAQSIYRDPATGVLYVCATTKTGTSYGLTTLSSADGGTTWSAPSAFLAGLSILPYSIGCRVDGSGLMAIYGDATDGLAKIVFSAP